MLYYNPCTLDQYGASIKDYNTPDILEFLFCVGGRILIWVILREREVGHEPARPIKG